MARIKGSRRVATRSAYTWRAFFKAIGLGRQSDTMSYVSTFSGAFKLRPADYQLGGRIVRL